MILLKKVIFLPHFLQNFSGKIIYNRGFTMCLHGGKKKELFLNKLENNWVFVKKKIPLQTDFGNTD